MQIAFKATDDLTAADRAGLRALSTAVYPPHTDVNLPGPFVWAPQQWHILVHDDTERIVTHVGVLTRDVLCDGITVHIGGVGGVHTHPDARGRGYASAAMARALAFFTHETHVPFALLVTFDRRSFYEGLGWQYFAGILNVEQPGGTMQFTANTPMVRAVSHTAPTSGVIDLQGLPW